MAGDTVSAALLLLTVTLLVKLVPVTVKLRVSEEYLITSPKATEVGLTVNAGVDGVFVITMLAFKLFQPFVESHIFELAKRTEYLESDRKFS